MEYQFALRSELLPGFPLCKVIETQLPQIRV
jgi:hypothetical protein